MAIFNSLTFDGNNSLDNQVYITGEAVYNAPERDVEKVSVPGRNGDIFIDKGRWNNIEVTYPAGTFGSTQSDYATIVRTYRNLLSSKIGYKVLTDSYHPDEYRLGVYKSGLEVSPVNQSTAGEFELVFDCKPQRFLTTGESAITVSSGDTITNSTLYDASPLIEAEGYGTITIGDYEVEIENAVMGEVTLYSSATSYTSGSRTITISTASYNTGDTITINASTVSFTLYISNGRFLSVTDETDCEVTFNNTSYLTITLAVPAQTLTAGTDSAQSVTASASYTYYDTDASATASGSIDITFTTTYTSPTITWSYSFTESGATTTKKMWKYVIGNIVVDSTLSILGDPTYLDCDLGVCYKVESDEVVDLNGYIDLGSDMPVLVPGSNTVTYDNTITDLKIIPRWWIL